MYEAIMSVVNDCEVTELEITHSCLRPLMPLLTASIKSNDCSLKALRVTNNDITDSEAIPLSAAVGRNKKLHTLDFSNNPTTVRCTCVCVCCAPRHPLAQLLHLLACY